MPHLVPKIIHQMWGTEAIPAPYCDYHRDIKLLNPECQVILWTDASIDGFVKDCFTQYYQRFMTLPYDVHRWDLFRYMALYHYGGIYVDIDIEPTKAFDQLFGHFDLILCREHPHDAEGMKVPNLLSNAVIVAAPKQPIFKALIDKITTTMVFDRSRKGVCNQTGPGLLTHTYERVDEQALLLDHNAFFPNHLPRPGKVVEQKVGLFGTHRFASTWWPQVTYKPN